MSQRQGHLWRNHTRPRQQRSSPIQFPNISPRIFSISLFGIEFALPWDALAYIVGILHVWHIVVAPVNPPSL